MLCKKCLNIHFKPAEDYGLPPRNTTNTNILLYLDHKKQVFLKKPEKYLKILCYFHHESKEKLEESVKSGCHFCGMIWHSRFITNEFWYPSRGFDDGQVIFTKLFERPWALEDFGITEYTEMFDIHCEGKQKSIFFVSNFSDPVAGMLSALSNCPNLESTAHDSEAEPEVSSIGLRKVEEALMPAAGDLANQRRVYSPWTDTNTISPANLTLARLWLRNCLQNHKYCGLEQANGILPCRVLDITDPMRPALLSTYYRIGNYATLSYKWGSCKKYVTTRANYDQHRSEIPFSKLPRTFREAIQVSSLLGFRYIWIDALCIIQDSEDDIQQQIGLMDQIYWKSTLTLFAAGGNDAEAGLSICRDPRALKPCLLSWKSSLDGEHTVKSKYVILDHFKPADLPLYTRGWVLQEEILSPRALQFESKQMSWRCLCSSASESLPGFHSGDVTSPENLENIDWVSKFRRQLKLPSDSIPKTSLGQRDNHFDYWYSMVENYTQRLLSYSSDVLSAICGLANMMATNHGCNYLAGLWQEDLQVGLSWYVASCSNPRQDDIESEDLFNVPAWTWASQWGKGIKFQKWQDNASQVVSEGLTFDSYAIDAYEPNLSTSSSVHQITLTVTGKMRRALVSLTLTERSPVEKVEGRFMQYIREPESLRLIGTIALDSSIWEVPLREIYLLLCMVREKYEKRQLTCLALVCIDRVSEAYTRVGLVSLLDHNWFSKPGITKTIHLV